MEANHILVGQVDWVCSHTLGLFCASSFLGNETIRECKSARQSIVMLPSLPSVVIRHDILCEGVDDYSRVLG